MSAVLIGLMHINSSVKTMLVVCGDFAMTVSYMTCNYREPLNSSMGNDVVFAIFIAISSCFILR